MIGQTDIAYIAGLFDGEGSIHYKRGPDLKDQNQPKETFTALNVHTDMICLDSLPEAICA